MKPTVKTNLIISCLGLSWAGSLFYFLISGPMIGTRGLIIFWAYTWAAFIILALWGIFERLDYEQEQSKQVHNMHKHRTSKY